MNTKLLDTETDRPLLVAASLLTTALFAAGTLVLLRAEADSVPAMVVLGFVVFGVGSGVGSVLYGIEGVRRRRE